MDVASLLNSMLGGGGQQPGQATADPMSSILGLVTGGQPQQGAAQSSQAQAILGKVLPAGMAFMRAKASGADTKSAAMQAAMSAMMGSNPLQAATPGGASGGLIAQSIMKSLLG
jgi:hypothetical protein